MPDRHVEHLVARVVARLLQRRLHVGRRGGVARRARVAIAADRVPGHVGPAHALGVAAKVRLGCRRCHRERDVARMEEAKLGDAVGERRASDAARVGPAVDTLLEEEPVEDELSAPLEQLRQRPPPLGALEAVVALDAHHRHPLPFGGELVHRGGDGLLALGHGRQSRVPLVWLTTGGWARVMPSPFARACRSPPGPAGRGT